MNGKTTKNNKVKNFIRSTLGDLTIDGYPTLGIELFLWECLLDHKELMEDKRSVKWSVKCSFL